MTRWWIATPILVLGLTAGSAPSATDEARQPTPLRGAPLGESRLRLLVPDNPPFVLDVDSGRTFPTRIPVLARRKTLRIFGIGGRSAVVVQHTHWQRYDIYAVRSGGGQVSSLGTGANVWPAADGQSVWIQSVVSRARCTLRRMGLDGRQLRAPHSFPCATGSDPAAGSLGVVSRRTRVQDPSTGRLVLKTRWGVLGGAGTTLLLAGPRATDGTSAHQFTLLNATTGSERRLRWPSILYGRDAPAIDPRGRFVALSFADPAWSLGGRQALDVWLVDVSTGRLTQLPGMPAFVSLKSTSLAWSNDGRLVLLIGRDGKYLVGVWRPGERRLALKPVQLPYLDAGSDAFAILG